MFKVLDVQRQIYKFVFKLFFSFFAEKIVALFSLELLNVRYSKISF